MRLTEAGLGGAFVIEVDRATDDRGAFARTFCATTFAAHGLDAHVDQQSLSWNTHAGTLRGLHFQRAPHGEAKLVRCVQGALFDAFVDLRPGSPTFGRAAWVELTAENARGLYLPTGFAHGFYTLEDHTTVLYQMSSPYVPDASAGLRWDDPALGIPWPGAPRRISPRDRAWPLLRELPEAGPAALPEPP